MYYRTAHETHAQPAINGKLTRRAVLYWQKFQNAWRRIGMHIEVACLPRDVTRLPERVVLVIDVLRATTTLVTLFERGCRSIALARDVLRARAAKAEQPESVLIGEVAGLPPADFAYGNSPVALADADLANHDLIFSTTNGTKALVAVAGAAGVIAACLRNGRAAAAAALELAQSTQCDISVMCAGRAGGTQQGLDDLICAGYLIEQLLAQTGGLIAPWQPDADFAASLARTPNNERELELDDSALFALRVYRGAVRDPLYPSAAEIATVFFEASAGQGLQRLGLAADVHFCAQIDVSSVVPRLVREDQTTRYPLLIVGI